MTVDFTIPVWLLIIAGVIGYLVTCFLAAMATAVHLDYSDVVDEPSTPLGRLAFLLVIFLWPIGIPLYIVIRLVIGVYGFIRYGG